ncbi:hypothetical protein HUE56_25950 (plasmid) [Azospirillum oryzae]|uniref:Uncharacterized protein n=1 Tax=Azospirillum oryzae TaxID=286727 RepID=A0A6N1AQA5_9PROT|nr:hypothetical protein [Azospirillum oryzae]KAA0587825.1 hypothetical protein FZ938_16715 [Azospirillum oryzae]QKS53941.1 hypothetical protein HUE56_25950 [Azospirillum oryzae]GLR77735.1 hypothetical protein GCM10007856_04030 [Azospirillum oryzae]
MSKVVRLRFPFDAADRAKIGSEIDRLVVTETPFDPRTDSTTPPSESLVLRFPLPAPQNPPQVRPIFPGHMRFKIDPDQAGALPTPESLKIDDGRISDASYARLPRKGIILVRAVSTWHTAALDMHAIPALGRAPILAWYGPVELTREFLEQSLLSPKGLKNGIIMRAPDAGGLIKPGDPAWGPHALSRFLAGRYDAPVTCGERDDGSDDDAVRLPMPVVTSDAPGVCALTVTLAWQRPEFQQGDPTDRADTRQEIVPTRLFLQHVRKHLVDGCANDPVADAVIGADAEEGTGPFHKALRDDLAELGFALATTDAENQYQKLEWALREFQIYAKMSQIARIRGASAAELPLYRNIEGCANPAIYKGHVSGSANQQTRHLIGLWKRGGFRCPVVISAFLADELDQNGRPRQEPRPSYGNLWSHDELVVPKTRMFVADFTGYYGGAPPDTMELSDLVAIGRYQSWEDWGGPVSEPPFHCHPDAEILPESLCGVSSESIRSPGNAEMLSTFKVIRAISEQECNGFFDSVNSYDDVAVSVGPFHWTAKAVDGELAAYIAYLKAIESRAGGFDGYSKAIGFFGIQSDKAFGKCWNKSLRAYFGGIGLESETWAVKLIRKIRNEGAYLRNWHAFYRWVMAGRSVPGYRSRMWDMARFRLASIASTPLRKDSVATLSDIFSSEQAMALVTRWHVYRPAHVVKGGYMGPKLEAVWKAVGEPDAAGARTAQQRIVTQLLAAMNNSGVGGSRQVIAPRWVDAPDDPKINKKGFRLDPALRELSLDPGSFRLDPPPTA